MKAIFFTYNNKKLIMKAIISKLRTMFPAEDFIVTGSFVLAEYGLMSMNDVHDLDIILVKPEPTTLEALNRWMKDSPAPSTTKLKTLPIQEVKEPEKKRAPIIDDDDELEDYAPPRKKVMKAEVRQSNLQAIFMFDKTKVDVYIEHSFFEPILLVEGIKYTTIPHIIKAKRSYDRMKDWLQCRDMAKVLFDPEKFEEMLNTSWKSTLREDY